MKVLIVDDSRVMRKIVLRHLRQAGFGDHEFVEAENGREGLERVRSDDFDLVLCDWNMPEMTGIEFLETLQAEGPRVPFGFVTSEGTVEMRQRATAAGALFVIAKPFTVEMFEQELSRVLASPV